MTETQYLEAVRRVLDDVLAGIDAQDLAADCALAGLVLTIEFDDGAKIVLNAQAPTQQLWLAARSGARHFVARDGHWIDTRDGAEFYAVLSRVVGEHAGQPVTLRPR
jgi:CyaY protein